MIDTESTLATRTQNKQIDCGALQHKLQTMIATKSTWRLQAQQTHETNNKQQNLNQRTTMPNTPHTINTLLNQHTQLQTQITQLQEQITQLKYTQHNQQFLEDTQPTPTYNLIKDKQIIETLI